MRAGVQGSPIAAAMRTNRAISATAGNRTPTKMHFTIAVFPASSEVGAGAGIVYGRAEANLPAVATDAPLDG
jgi:hypothetical protein